MVENKIKVNIKKLKKIYIFSNRYECLKKRLRAIIIEKMNDVNNIKNNFY